ncbi:MAG TPA: SHOCT domain-containing protein [Ktedonobacterales bacterium]
MVMRRRVGRPLLRTAVVGGAAYAAGHSAAKGAAREEEQNQRLAELEQQTAYQQPAPYPPRRLIPLSQPPIHRRRLIPPQAGYPPPASMPAPSAATEQAGASVPPDRITQLKMLADLRASGVLNDQEFETEKRRILQQS